MIELVMLCLTSAAFAEPEPPPATPETGIETAGVEPGPPTRSEPEADTPATDGSFASVLEIAKQRYFQGESTEARELLQGLQLRLYAGEEADWSSIVEALIYLGEIYYVQGDQDQAQMAFQYLLERDPTTPISPYHHAIEVVNLFELVRTTVIANRKVEVPVPVPEPIVERTPAPIWTFAPFGVPQLTQGRTALGLFYGGLQVGLGATSLALFPYLDKVNRGGDDHPAGWDDPEVTARVQQRRYAWQWPATFGFYAVWGISMIDAARWHQRHPKIVGVGLQSRELGRPTPSAREFSPGGGDPAPDPIALPDPRVPILAIHGQL
jgi:hypothetical protein